MVSNTIQYTVRELMDKVSTTTNGVEIQATTAQDGQISFEASRRSPRLPTCRNTGKSLINVLGYADLVDVSPHLHESGLKLNLYTPPQ